MTAPILLYSDPLFISPYVLSTFVALREKDIPFEIRSVDLRAGEQRRPAYGGALTGRVPTLVHGDFWLSESAWCIADVDLALALQRLIRNDDGVPGHVEAYAEAQWARPSVRAFVDQQRPDYYDYYA